MTHHTTHNRPARFLKAAAACLTLSMVVAAASGASWSPVAFAAAHASGDGHHHDDAVMPTPLQGTKVVHKCIQDTDIVQEMIAESTYISDAFSQWSDELVAPNSTFDDDAANTAAAADAAVARGDHNTALNNGDDVNGAESDPFRARRGRLPLPPVKRSNVLNRTALDDMAERHGWKKRSHLRRQQVEEQRRAAVAQDDTGPIRFSISTLDLSTSGQYCASSGQTVPDMQGYTTTCGSDDILTADKRNFLVNVLLPRATAILAQHLQIVQLTTNLVVSSTTVCGSQYTVPSGDVSTGIGGADYRLYVAAVPASEGVLAWAAGCQLASDNRRFIVGRANFAPQYLDPTGDVDSQIVTATHEMTHALGFTYGRFTALGMTSVISIRSKTTNAIVSPLVVAQAKLFYNCDSVPGAELEDEGGAGSTNSHWEKRTFVEEIMTSTSGERYSPMTLSAMETIGYIANYSSAWPMITGRNTGCGFITQKCNTAEGGKDTAFCFTGGATGCTTDFLGYGTCVVNEYTSALPTYFQYFSDPKTGGPTFYDGCPVILSYSNRRCIDASYVATSNEQLIGLYFGEDSRCVPTSGLIQNGYTGAVATGTCLKSRCVGGVVQVAVGSGGWLTCAADGQTLTASGYYGSITCPVAATFCLSFGSGSSVMLPLPTTDAPVASGTAAAATDTKYTAKGTMIITGGGWGNVIRNAPALLTAALQMDIAEVLGVELQQVLILSTTVGSLVTVYVANGPTVTQANQAFDTMISNGGRDGIGRTLYVYANNSDNTQDSPTAVSHNAVGQNDNVCANTWSALDTDAKCYGVIAAIAVAAFLIIVLIAVCLTRRFCNKSQKTDRQIANVGYGYPGNAAAGVGAGGGINGGGMGNGGGPHAVFPYQGTVRAAAAQQAAAYGSAPPAMNYYGAQGVPVSNYPAQRSYGSVGGPQQSVMIMSAPANANSGSVFVESVTDDPSPKGAGKVGKNNSPTGYVDGGATSLHGGRRRNGGY